MGSTFKFVADPLNLFKMRDTAGQKAAKGAAGVYSDINTPNLQPLGPSAMAGVDQGPEATNAQNTSLSGLTDLATQQGLSASDQAKLKQISDQQRINEQGQRGAIDANARMHGLASSGMTLANKLLSSQGQQNNANVAGTDVLAGADNRRLTALNNLGSLGTTVGNSRFTQGAQKASAADMINAYNKINLPQQNFNNQLELGAHRANAMLGVGSTGEKAQQEKEANIGGIASMVGSFFSDKRLKKNIKDGSSKITSLLDSVKPNEFEYKDSEMGEGKQAGPMAQELEKNELGKSAVIDTPMGKAVHPGKLAALSLASAKTLHERVKKLEKAK